MVQSSPALKVALISMPWAIFNRPSVQLGTLKAYTERNSTYKLKTYHPYLNIAKAVGTDLYAGIAHSGWAGEALFAPLLYEEKREDAEKLFHESLSPAHKTGFSFTELSRLMESECRSWVETHDLAGYRLAGFSICFSQLFSSLYMARLLKERYPELVVVFGGSSCVGDVGCSLLHSYREIDFIIDGEGEERLLNLCRYLDGKTDILVQGVLAKKERKQELKALPPLALNNLPIPDYSSYFLEMKQLFSASPFIPTLPVEFSRGCWWNRCTFCNLNVQWQNYRYKSGERMVQEVLGLAGRFETLHFTFTDNALPPAEADQFFKQISMHNIDFDFFAEIRSTAKADRLKLYRNGGLTTVQVGVEALSNSLLKKMDKGSSVMDNIAMMKLCMQENITLEGNLIMEFPGSSRQEMEETLENLTFVFAFAPLSPASFFLGYGSPVCKAPKSYAIKNIMIHPKNKLLFPVSCQDSMTMLINSYRGDRTFQTKLWQPVRQQIVFWKQFHDRRRDKRIPALSCRDGGNFLIIRQERVNGPTLHHRLRGLSREIYVAAQTPIRIEKLRRLFPQVAATPLNTYIEDMCRKRLMYREGGKALALAIPMQ